MFGSKIKKALRKAFPHFEGGAPITPEAIEAVGREWDNMVMNWAPVARKITFTDDAGKKVTLELVDFDDGEEWQIVHPPGDRAPEPVNWAEGLIRQLPDTHDGRNSWLRSHGRSDEAKAIRKNGSAIRMYVFGDAPRRATKGAE